MMMLPTMLLPTCLWVLAVYASAIDQGFMSEYTVHHHDDAKYLLLFGDSYTRIAFDPTGAMPSKDNIIGNPAWPGQATSGGLNWATVLASQYNNSLTLVYDYAYGGATINNYLIIPVTGFPLVDLNDQVVQFKANLTKDEAPRWAAPGRSIAAVWFGQNDVYELYNRSTSEPYTIMDVVFDDYFDRMGDLHQHGVRNFLWIGVSPMERSPLVRAAPQANQTRVAVMCKAFNERLSKRAQGFGDAHPDITWHYYDPAPAFHRVLDNPTLFGSPDANCQNSDGVSCLWWNDIHPGVRIHEQVAADLAVNDTIRPLFNSEPRKPKPWLQR